MAGKAVRVPSPPGAARPLNLTAKPNAAAQVAARKGTAASSHAPLAPLAAHKIGAN